ncbi:conjugative transfer signal peptidase TraF [Paremcibacter congregatus]|uniref:conjugative transfer signal peptidase TraF n=1 Tax=Paremcibacter congregatus TaxID=2043170 RepID=UPI0030ED5FBD|tara:strand:- start:1323 stop:1823 length:501 start_codon:yes stop_codon:yes gene_type:complete
MKKTVIPILLAAISGVGLIGVASVSHTPLLIWNASASAPIGLYRLTLAVPKHGDLVLVSPPESLAKFAAERGYLAAGVPMIKRIAAMGGDDVCALHNLIMINGKIIARQFEADRAGRPMPRWRECRALADDEIFLILPPEDSFDSRYFGPVQRSRIMGRILPLWIK